MNFGGGWKRSHIYNGGVLNTIAPGAALVTESLQRPNISLSIL
jgi:hypothetical protein